MILAGAVACLTRDAKVGDLRLEQLLGLVGLGLWAGGVATDTVHVPVFLRDHRVWIANEQAVAWCPALILHQPREGEADLQIAHHTRQPKHLHVVRAGDHAHAHVVRLGVAAVWCCLGCLETLDRGPIFIAPLVHGESFAPKSKRLAIERRHDGVGRHDLGHAPVVGIMPAFVFVGVAFAAGGGAGVLIVAAPEGQGDFVGVLLLCRGLAKHLVFGYAGGAWLFRCRRQVDRK